MTGAVLVTGGAGFIGSNIVARMARDQSRDVIVCDTLGPAESGKWRNLAGCPIGDIVPPGEIWRLLQRRGKDIELIIHLGAISSTTESDVDAVLATNFGLSRDLFRWCAEHETRLIYASSAATYGDGALGFDDAQDLESLAALRPLNPYGWSKALFDLYAVREAARGHAPTQWAGLKFFNVYGPGEEHKGSMRSVASKIWPDVVAGRPVKLFRSHHPDYADGGQMRDFVYVEDAVDAVEWLADHPAVSGLFNLGSGRARSFIDLAVAVFQAARLEARIDYIEMPDDLRPRYQYFTEARMDRLREAGFSRQMTPLEDGIADYVGRFLSSPDPSR